MGSSALTLSQLSSVAAATFATDVGFSAVGFATSVGRVPPPDEVSGPPLDVVSGSPPPPLEDVGSGRLPPLDVVATSVEPPEEDEVSGREPPEEVVAPLDDGVSGTAAPEEDEVSGREPPEDDGAVDPPDDEFEATTGSSGVSGSGGSGSGVDTVIPE